MFIFRRGGVDDFAVLDETRVLTEQDRLIDAVADVQHDALRIHAEHDAREGQRPHREGALVGRTVGTQPARGHGTRLGGAPSITWMVRA